LPNIYSSTAVVQISFPENTTEQYTEGALIALTKQQAVLVEKPSILHPVIKELQLQEIWGREGERLPRDIARKILENSVRVSADKQAVGLIKISVKRDNPNEAAKIANAISLAYKNESNDVTIVKMAGPNNRPVSPDLFMNVLVSVALAILLMAAGVVLLILGIKTKKKGLTNQLSLPC
jgi:capsular polysaccharide biosynthesis protein